MQNDPEQIASQFNGASNAKFKMGKLIVIVGVVIITVVSAIYAWRSGVFEPKPARLVVSPLEYDLGKVKQSGGAVPHIFAVRNEGGQDAQVGEVLTSCSCTTAEINKKVIKPEETADFKVIFDPNYHFEDEGRFFRTATIKYNSDFLAEAKIYVEVDYDLGKDKLKFPLQEEKEEHKD